MDHKQYHPLELLEECLHHSGDKEEADFVSRLKGRDLDSQAAGLTILENRLPPGDAWRSVLLAKAAITNRTPDAHEKLFWLKLEMAGFPRHIVEEMTDHPPSGEV